MNTSTCYRESSVLQLRAVFRVTFDVDKVQNVLFLQFCAIQGYKLRYRVLLNNYIALKKLGALNVTTCTLEFFKRVPRVGSATRTRYTRRQ